MTSKLFILFLLCGYHCIQHLDVNIDGTNGVNNINCVSVNATNCCETLQYAYNNVINTTLYESIRLFIVGSYRLSESLVIDQDSTFIKSIIIASKNSTIISPILPHLNVVLGSSSENLLYNITFENIVFQNFGSDQPAIITAWNIILNIYGCKFTDNFCAAINCLDCNVFIASSLFMNNNGNAIRKGVISEVTSFPFGNYSAGGAVGLIFQKSLRKYAILLNNVFQQNRALSLVSKCIAERNGHYSTKSQFGGALLLAFIEQATKIKVLLQGNLFRDNEASLGGAFMLSFHDESGYNDIIVDNSTIVQNTGTITGGGFTFAAWGFSSDNTFILKNSKVMYNSSPVGGGGKILLQSRDLYSKSTPSIQFITFDNVTFSHNQAASSSGLHLIFNLALSGLHSGQKPIVPVELKNVTFALHKTTCYSAATQGPSAFSGVLLSNRVDLYFNGSSYFFNNSLESSIYLSNSEMHLVGNLTFLHNSVQTSGGGMTLNDVSHLYLYPGSNLLFQENTAQVQGGAMFIQTVGFPDMVYEYNPSCFLRYHKADIPPSHWNVSLRFIRNSAGLKGAAIFANTITSCIWQSRPPCYDFKKALRWSDSFVYNGNFLFGNSPYHDSQGALTDIATDTTHFEMNFSPNQVLEAAPGDKVPFKLTAFDEISNEVYSVPLASSSSLFKNGTQSYSKITLDKKYYIVKPYMKKQQEMTFKTTDVDYAQMGNANQPLQEVQFLDSYSSFLSNASILIRPKKCQPGFVFDKGTCNCDVHSNENILRCGEGLVYIPESYWANVTSYGTIYMTRCPPFYCKCNANKTAIGCAFNYKNADLQCVEGRSGPLCGRCLPGLGLNFMTSKCVPCTGFSWPIILLAIITCCVFIAAILILVFNPCFSTHMRGILFFVQMLPYVTDPTNTVVKIVLMITSWVDLDVMNNVPVNGCLVEGFTSMDAITLGYLYPAIILLVLLFMYILHKLYLLNFQRRSPFQAFWILMVVSYKFLLETSFLLLFCVPMEGKYVFFYDASITCYEGIHLIMTISAIAVTLTLVIPPPIIVTLVTKGLFPVGPSISDALAQGLRVHVRWWWAVDFTRRIIFVAIYVFVTDLKQTAFAVACVFALFFHTNVKPYRNKQANIGESYLLVTLTLLVIVKETESQDSIQDYFIDVLLIVSTLYCILMTVYLSLMYFTKICRLRPECSYQVIEDDDEMYKESIRRRLAYIPGLKRAATDPDKFRHVPSPSVTRSDLKDVM